MVKSVIAKTHFDGYCVSDVLLEEDILQIKLKQYFFISESAWRYCHRTGTNSSCGSLNKRNLLLGKCC